MKKKNIIIILLLLFISIGGTLAYFTSTSTLENEFKSGKYKTVSTDSFTSPSDWAPGDTTPKTITTKNEGTLPVRVRVKLEEEWKSENGDELSVLYNFDPVSIINFDNEDDWAQDGDYYYYKDILNPGETTSSLIKSVTYNPNIPSDMDCTSVNGVYNCKSSGDGYDGGTYTLNITVETAQSDAALSAWNLAYEPTEESYVYTSNTPILGVDIDTNVTDYQVEEDYQSTNQNVFLRLKVQGQTIKGADVGFILNNNVYYLKGASLPLYNNSMFYYSYDEQLYDRRKESLIGIFGSSNCFEAYSSLNDFIYFRCLSNDITAEIRDSGEAFVDDGEWKCSGDFTSRCEIANMPSE